MLRNEDNFYRSLPAGFDGLFDWDFLLPAFAGTKIRPMDVDALIERNGQFLVFETKEPGTKVSTGQRITLERLVHVGCFTVFFVQGKKPEEIEEFEIWYQKEGEFRKLRVVAGSKVVLQYTRRW